MKSQKGSISIFVLVLGVVFSITIGGLALFGSVQYTNGRRTESYQRSISIAEAGANYYRWHLAHDLTDYQDGTGGPGPYVHVYNDPETGQPVGTFSLDITPPPEGSGIVTVKSTGWSSEHPTIKRTVTAKYGPDSLTKYAWVNNGNVWFGQGINISGEVFSNGGIRMDGTHDSLVRSAKATYTCGSETGCNPTEEKPGVWGNGGPQELWEFPALAVDFESVVVDFNLMKQVAQTTGVYLPTSNDFGYHFVFSSDGNVTVYEVISADKKKGWEPDEGCFDLFQIITNEQLIGVYNVSDEAMFFVEDTVWVDGVISGKATLAAARMPTATYKTDLWINDNLTYDVLDGSTTLGLVAQNNIIFAHDIPQNFEVHSILFAQNGRVIRHHYNQQKCSHGPKAIRQSLRIRGSVIGKKNAYWNFSGHGGIKSGFINREILFDQNAINSPPPYYPSSGQMKLLSWEEDVE